MNQADPEAAGRIHIQKLARGLKLLNLSAKAWFESLGITDTSEGVGQMQLFKSLRHMSDELQPKLGPRDRFKFNDECILEMMNYLDPNQDGTTTLDEITEGLWKSTEDPNQNKGQAAAAKVRSTITSEIRDFCRARSLNDRL